MSFVDLFRKIGNSTERAKDPVCGMKVDLEKTQYKSDYQGKSYGFCSQSCKETFDKKPEEYRSS